MRRTAAQEVMDAARGDPEGKLRSAAWERYSAVQEETNRRGWFPPDPNAPQSVVRGERVVVPSFPIADIRPWAFHEPSTVSVPADPGPNTKRKG